MIKYVREQGIKAVEHINSDGSHLARVPKRRTFWFVFRFILSSFASPRCYWINETSKQIIKIQAKVRYQSQLLIEKGLNRFLWSPEVLPIEVKLTRVKKFQSELRNPRKNCLINWLRKRTSMWNYPFLSFAEGVKFKRFVNSGWYEYTQSETLKTH